MFHFDNNCFALYCFIAEAFFGDISLADEDLRYARISQNSSSRDLFDELQVEDPDASSQYSDKEFYSRIEKYLSPKNRNSPKIPKANEEKSKKKTHRHRKNKCPKG